MKKIFTLLAAATLAAAPTLADSLIPGATSLTQGSPTTSSSSSLPIYFDGNDADGSTWYSASQSIFPASLLSKIAPSVAADGSKTTAKISAVSFTIAEGSAYIESGTLDIDLWIQNVESDEFAVNDSNKPQWGAYADGVRGHVSIEGDTFNEGAPVDVKITFDTPLIYEGKALQMTFSASCDYDDQYGGWYGGVYTFNPGVGHTCSGLLNGSSEPVMSGTITTTTSSLPIVDLTYEVEKSEPVAAEPVRGEESTALIGNYDNPSIGSESQGAVIPFDARFGYSYCQTLYTADMLTELNQIIDGKASKAEISDLTFKMNTNGEFSTLLGQKTFTVYVQNTDETEFPVENNVKQWFTVDATVTGTYQTPEYSYDDESCYVEDEVIEYKIILDTPIIYEGKSLLISWMTEGDFENENMDAPKFYSQVFNAPDGKIHSGVISKDAELDFQSGALNNSSKDLPVLKIGYTPLIQQNGAQPVSFGNVELKLEGVDVTGNSTYSKANIVAATFDVVDPANVGEYEIFSGTQSLGTISGTSGTIRYIPVGKNDIVLKIEAKGEGTIGTNFTIAADEIQALFPVPDAEFTGEYALYTSFDVYNVGSGTINGAAQFRMSSTAPVARMKVTTSGNNIQMMHPGGSYSDNVEALMPEGVTSANYYILEDAGGILGLYNSNVGTCNLVGDELSHPASVSISGQFSCLYPVVTQAVPTVTTGTVALGEAVSGTISEVSKDFNNGSSWSSSTISATMALDEAHFVADLVYPSKLRVKEDARAKTLQFFAPKGEKIQWILEPKSRAEGSWTTAPTNPYTISTANLEPGRLTVRTVDADDQPTTPAADNMIYTINDDGTALSIKSVVATGTESVVIFDLQGRRLQNPAKGVNIVNGKKIIF